MKRARTTCKKPKRLPLPVGNSDWAHVVEHDWHADKTQLISGLLDRDATVALFTRPRRFGKTFALRMLKTFFEKTEKPNAGLFRNTKVWKNAAHRAEQGRYPVLHITLKDSEHCRLGVMTGILRVAKEGVLSGLNNPKVYSVFDADFSDCFGFTEAEVRELLTTYGHPEKMDEARAWYDGYRFGGREIYNPWSLLNYVDDGFTPQLYWLDTSSNDLVADAMSRMTADMRDALADFFEKKEAEVPCSKELGRYGQIQNNPQIIWSLLVHTGYLKVLSGPDVNKRALLAFPNRELVSVFRDDTLDPITCTPTVGSDLQGILSSLTNGDGERFRKSIERFLVSSASYYDTAKEDFFHGLVLGLLAIGRDYFEIRSNREEGDGRPDILMKPLPGVTLPGVVLAFKSPKIPARASQKRRDALLAAAAKEARRQIDKKRYAAEMEAVGIAVLKYGIGFSGKHVALASQAERISRKAKPQRKIKNA